MPQRRDLVTGVIQLANLLTRRLAPVFEKHHVTPQQWAVLSAIDEEETAATLVALSRRLMVTKQNMTGMVARLEQLGFAERHGDPHDLRSSRVQLTRRGRTLLEKLRPGYEAWLKSVTAEIGDRDLQTVMRALERLIVRLEQQA
ncbi:MAG: MarR family transcriptional regulator [Thermoanaerobaculia bacterium]